MQRNIEILTRGKLLSRDAKDSLLPDFPLGDGLTFANKVSCLFSLPLEKYCRGAMPMVQFSFFGSTHLRSQRPHIGSLDHKVILWIA